MNEVALQEQITRLEKECRFGGAQTDQQFLDLRAEVNRLRLELRAMRRFLAQVYPSFENEFPQILSRTIEEVNPEFE